MKCAYDNYWRKGEEFGDYKVGCPNTPARYSYYCTDHKDYRMEFKVDDNFIQLQPKDIKISRLSKYQILGITGTI